MGRLDNILENNILNLENVIEPYAGMQTGFGRQAELARKVNQRTLIAGKGIKLTQGTNGIIIEASDITITNLNTIVSPLMTLAQVGKITDANPEDGVYSIDFLAEAENNEYTTIDSDKFIFVNNNMLAFSAYNNGDAILVYKTLVKTLDSGATDSTGATGA
jgi:hypothetical protein